MTKVILLLFAAAAVVEVLRLLHGVTISSLAPLTLFAGGMMLTLLGIVGGSDRKP